MANRKISQFTTQTDITQIQGLAGYDNSVTNVQISGNQLITSLEENLYKPFGANGTVLTINNGAPAWVIPPSGSSIEFTGEDSNQTAITVPNATQPLDQVSFDGNSFEVSYDANASQFNVDLKSGVSLNPTMADVYTNSINPAAPTPTVSASSSIASLELSNTAISLQTDSSSTVSQAILLQTNNAASSIQFSSANAIAGIAVAGSVDFQGGTGATFEQNDAQGITRILSEGGTQVAAKTLLTISTDEKIEMGADNLEGDFIGPSDSVLASAKTFKLTGEYGTLFLGTDGNSVQGVSLSPVSSQRTHINSNLNVNGFINIDNSQTTGNGIVFNINGTSTAGNSLYYNRGTTNANQSSGLYNVENFIGDFTGSPNAYSIVNSARSITAGDRGGDVIIKSTYGAVKISSGENTVGGSTTTSNVEILTDLELEANLLDINGSSSGVESNTGAPLLATGDTTTGGVKWGPSMLAQELVINGGALVTPIVFGNWAVGKNQNAYCTANITGSTDLTIAGVVDGSNGTLVFTITTGEVNWPTGSLFAGGPPTLPAGTHAAAFVYVNGNYYWSIGESFSG